MTIYNLTGGIDQWCIPLDQVSKFMLVTEAARYGIFMLGVGLAIGIFTGWHLYRQYGPDRDK